MIRTVCTVIFIVNPMVRKTLSTILSVLLTVTLLIIPFANVSELMSGSQSGKSFYFAFAAMGLVIAAITSKLITRNSAIRIKPLDAVIGLYFCYSVLHPWLFGYTIPSIIWIETISLALFYMIVRQVSEKYLIVLVLGVSLAGMAQAIYGNMQLWGYYPSNHGIFRMTGSFFNPGPYAGYLGAILPVTIGLYFGRSNVRESDSLIVRKLESLIVRLFDRLKTSIAQPQTLKLFFKRSNYLFSNAKPSNSATSNIVPSADGSNDEAPNISNIEVSNISNGVVLTLLNGMALITIIAIVLVLPASRSRAAWLGAIAGCLYIFQTFKRFSNNQTFFQAFKHFKQLLIVAGILFFAIALIGMYKFKQGSADGRLLIWKVSAGMIKDKPILGHGADKFAADYMNYQAAYFKPNPDVPEAMQADNVTYAYNEILKLTVEKGLMGLLLALAVIWSLFFVKREKGEEGEEDRRQKLKNSIVLAARGSLLSILVFAQFSYPSEILPIKILFVLFAAVVATHQTPIKLFNLMPTPKATFASTAAWYAALAMALITVYSASQYLTRQYQAYKSWKDASDIYNMGAYTESLEDFELSYTHLKTNGAFLVQYGKALEMAEKYENSIAILNEAKLHLNNTILYTCLGNNYKAMNKNTEAEQAYLQAFNMAPARFYPLYLLAKLYDETGQKEKAVEMATKVMEKEVKIESTAVKEVKEEMRKIIEKGEAEILNEGKIHTDNNLDPIYKGTKEGASRSKVYTSKFMLQKW